MCSWRYVGLNYINYSSIAARLVRQALKPEFQKGATARNQTHIRIKKWVDGKPIRSETKQ